MTRVNLDCLGPRPEERASVALIAQRLRDAILSGALATGVEIRQQAVADHFCVSRMPVREALRQVQTQGLIEYRSHRSLIVAARKPDGEIERVELLEIELRKAKEAFDFMHSDPDAAATCWQTLAMQKSNEISALLNSTH
ncbi:GntR family transcriptional regulator [Pseudomonas syringae group genomosp. 3]|uniref:GntR family transcriptional regulator n=1 Tax=Pseudomonas syringae group genomosp. 3 TaxID=251701 RepID=UPI001067A4FD|nr:GntR family transcriptional regulator [Pseudomonas syringae group genomosp. 3]TES72600.1 GntR family transcriptional regulator [Pseudomonas syringae pv. tomato]